MKIGVLSHVLPGMSSGQGTVLGRVVGGLEPTEAVVIGSPRARQARGQVAGRHPVRCLPVDLPPRLGRVALPAATLLRAHRVARIITRERCDAVVACTGDLLDLPAGYLAARRTGLPFYAYLFDDYRDQWRERLPRLYARLVEPVVMRGAAGAIVTNEFMRDEYRMRYAVRATIVRNPHPYRRNDVRDGPAQTADQSRICYTGAVYDVNDDALRALIAALSRVRSGPRTLDLYTAQPPQEITRRGTRGPINVFPHVANEEALAVQRAAGALYLPLGFRPGVRGIVRTAAPGKMGEYLASGRPILAHAPPDSFVTWYVQKHACGLLVDQPGVAPLVAALERLADEDLCRRLVTNALNLAREVFTPEAAQRQFRAAVMGGAGW